MRKVFFFLFIPIFLLSAPLVEIATKKPEDFSLYLRRSFPKGILNIVIHKNYSTQFIAVNGKSLGQPRQETRFKSALKKAVENAIKEEKSSKIQLDALGIKEKDGSLIFSFSPCNYGKEPLKGRWVAFIVNKDGLLLHKVEGGIELPAGACGRPITFSWVGKYKPEKIDLIVAIYDSKGQYKCSKSTVDMEVKNK